MNKSLRADTNIKNSYWYTSNGKIRSPLDYDTTADVVVVGGGPGGLSAAYNLAEKGCDVVLLEAREVGSGGLGNSTGIITVSGFEPELREYLESHDLEGTRVLWTYAEKAAQNLRRTIETEDIDCARYSGALSLHTDKKEAAGEIAAYEKIGLRPPVLLADDVARQMIDTKFDGPNSYKAVLLYDRDYSINPIAFARGFADASERRGARVYEGSPVRNVDTKRKIVTLQNGKRVSADNIVVATNPYTLGIEGVPRWLKRRSVSVHNYVTHAEVTKTPNGRMPFDGTVNSFFDDGLSPVGYTYGRVVDGSILIGSAESICFTTTRAPRDPNYFTNENMRVLSEMFPGYEFRPVKTWGGKIAEVPEGIPKMGEVSAGVYTTLVGDSISMAFLGGQLTAELIHNGTQIPKQLDINSRLHMTDEIKRLGLVALPTGLIDSSAEFYANHFD